MRPTMVRLSVPNLSITYLTNDSFSEILRVIWARGKARGDRWTEEVVIVLEEMRRTLAYCNWKQNWWRERLNRRTIPTEVMDGVAAYALKQSDIWITLAESFASMWAPLIRDYNLPADWPPPYSINLPGQSSCVSAIGRNWVSRVVEALRQTSKQVPLCRIQDHNATDSSSSDSD